MANNQLNVRFKISQAQYECLWLNDHIRFRIVAKGRRVGLTYGVVKRFSEKMLQSPINCLWGDVTYDNIRKYAERMFIPVLLKELMLKKTQFDYNKTNKTLRIGDSICDFRSAQDPQTWEGFGYHYIYLNEAGIILQEDEYLYYNAVLPMMMDYKDSKLIAAGVPKGRKGVFWDLWQKATEGKNKEYKAFNYCSYDNPFIDAKTIKSVEERMDDVTAKQEIYGQFVDHINNPFAYAFSREKHVRSCPYDPKLPVYLSFDFNVEPITCIVGQEYEHSIHIIKEFRLMNSDIFELCKHIKAHFPKIGGVTGDATGFARSAISAGNVNYYTIIGNELRLSDVYIQTPTINPSHHNSRALTNSLLARHPKLFIDPSCEYLINDLLYVETDATGKINKSKDKHQSHLLDCFRYYLYTFHNDFLLHIPDEI